MPSAVSETPLEVAALVERLAIRHAAVRALLDCHRDDHGELLAHVFFGDVTRHYQKLCQSQDIEAAMALVTDIDAGLERGGEDVDNLIHLSFLENLNHQRSGVAWELLTPRLKRGFNLVHGHTGPS